MAQLAQQQQKKPWYQIKNQTAKSAEILLYDAIGDFEGVSAKEFVSALNTIQSETITLRVNSPGGSVFDAVAIYNGLLNHPAKIRVKIEGIALSAASIVIMAGDEISMADNALMMIHQPLFEALFYVNAEDLRKQAELLDKNTDIIINTYQKRSSLSKEELLKLMQAETWLNAEEAKKIGFIDAIDAPLDITNRFNLSNYNKTPKHLKELSMSDPIESTTFNQQEALIIVKQCQAAGFPELVALAFEKNLTQDQVTQKINEAKAIQQLCQQANHSDQASGFIQQGKTVDQVRATLFDLMVNSQPTIDNHLPPNNPDTTHNKPMINTTAIYSKRNQSH